MITRDYFLRMIHQLAHVLAKVLKLNEARLFDESQEEVQSASRRLLGMDLHMLTSLSDAEFVHLLGLGDRFDVEKCVAAAELLRMAADVKYAQQDEPSAYHCRVTSLSLFLELLQREAGTLPNEYYETVERLISELSVYELPVGLVRKVLRYHELRGRLDLAENILYELMEREPGVLAEGVDFYGRLQAKSDDELAKGGLSRNEVEEGLERLRRRTSGQ